MDGQTHGYFSASYDELTLESRPQDGEVIAVKKVDARAALEIVDSGERIVGGCFCGYINKDGEWRLEGTDRLIVKGVDRWVNP